MLSFLQKAIVPLLIFAAVALSRTSMVLFPLANTTGNTINDWVGYAIPELFFRSLTRHSNMQVWDPCFLFNADSSGWTMRSDSLLKKHRERWGWNIATGGLFRVDKDTVVIEFRFVVAEPNEWARKKITVRGNIKTLLFLCGRLYAKFTRETGISGEKDVPDLRNNSMIPANYFAWATYAAGYGYEMKRQYASALSAYSRALDLEPSFFFAAYRAAHIYLLSGHRE
ncbi:MAG: hypothetical protein GF350_03950, partial [Chitinivibrionales bacterium]|nr:hypothetical protein [Chitinivibrionales bacterium]